LPEEKDNKKKYEKDPVGRAAVRCAGSVATRNLVVAAEWGKGEWETEASHSHSPFPLHLTVVDHEGYEHAALPTGGFDGL